MQVDKAAKFAVVKARAIIDAPVSQVNLFFCIITLEPRVE